MIYKDLALFGLCTLAALIVLPGCSSVDTWGAGVSVGSQPTVRTTGPAVHSGGPPDHAPAHGYRRKHHKHDVELEYDSGLGVYVVLGYQGLFFHGEYFYRMDDAGSWRVSVNMEGPWRSAADEIVPAGLHKHGKDKNKGKGKNKGRGRGNR